MRSHGALFFYSFFYFFARMKICGYKAGTNFIFYAPHVTLVIIKKYDLAVDKWGLILVLEDPDPVEEVSW